MAVVTTGALAAPNLVEVALAGNPVAEVAGKRAEVAERSEKLDVF